ncbi:fungal-specific transcription factor domain-containing protein [Mycena capillaripes]|nr:fungal-specific transcription factor domain-containing protein [Mycena capillaripes]
MSSDEDQTGGISIPAKKRRVQRACDMCRRKKRACDGLRMSEKKCTNCVENGLECTFAGAVAKRRSYVDALEARLELTEQLLRKLSPQNNESSASSSQSPGSSQWSSESPILKHGTLTTTPAGGSEAGPGVLLASLNIRSMNTPAPVPYGDDLAHIALTEDLQNLSINQVRHRFQGKSSGAMLVKAAIQLREGYEEKDIGWSSRRMHYWTYNPVKHKVPHVGPFVFPESDLLQSLIDLYFFHQNLYFPVLHKPSFQRDVADGLHIRDSSFGTVVLLVCAIGARYSDDARVSPPGSEPLRCGWEFFDQIPFNLEHLFETPTVHHLQYYCLATSFLEYSAPSACWTLIGLGIRLAQDVGAHRHQGSRPTVESELWKRGFWILVSYDRKISMALGRSCATQYEDIDAELPVECDDEFWETDDPTKAFVQPPDKPSQITFFNCYLRLNNLLATALKMLYTLNKTKKLLSYRDPAWEEHIVAELDSALNGWVDSIPPHLRWDPNRRDEAFFDQSVFLYCSYYQVQMTIHRPFIPTIRDGAPTSLPSLAICTNAARSCSHVADISRLRKNGVPVSVLIGSVFTSGVILLLNVWSGKHTGLSPQMNSAITEVHKCMATMRVCEKRWQTAGLYFDLLSEIATINQLPLPKAPSQPATSAPSNAHKRAREDDDAMKYPRAAAPLVQYPPYANTHHSAYPPHPTATSAPAVNATQTVQYTPLPTYTSDLGRLPVFHQQAPPLVASTSSWYPTQSATPLAYPDFAVVVAPPNDGTQNMANVSDGGPLFAPNGASFSGPNFGAAGDGMDNDIMAMWANAPTGFEMDDWGSYFSVMSELNQGLDKSVPQQ